MKSLAFLDPIRALRARHLGKGANAVTLAMKSFGSESGAVRLLEKSGVGALVSADPFKASTADDTELFEAVLERSVPGQMASLRRVPFNVRTLRPAASARGYWVGESKPIPVSKTVIGGSSLSRRKVAAIVLATAESFESSNPRVERLVTTDIVNALVGVVDSAFLDASNAGIAGTTPPAVTHGATIASTNNPAADIALLLEQFDGDLATAYFAADPLTLAKIAMARDDSGAFLFPNVGARGGEILGIPALASRNSPFDTAGGQLALIDAAGIAFAAESIELSLSTQATIEASDAPTGASDTPVAASQQLISLFQENAVAIKAVVHTNFEVQRPGAAIAIAGADYGLGA